MAIKFVRKRRKNADGSFDIVHYETQAKVVWCDDGESLQEKIDNGTLGSAGSVEGGATDYTTYRPRNISLQQDSVSIAPANGELVGVYTIA